MAQLVKTALDCARQVTIVNGLKRYAAATAADVHLDDFREDVKSGDDADTPLSAIWRRGRAVKRSIIMYTTFVKIGEVR